MNGFTLECCVDSVESALAAREGGATRLELCSGLQLGGLTPSLSLFRCVRQCCDLPVNVLIRPRFGDFLYSPHELAVIEEDATLFASEGANAVVIGFLNPDGSLDCGAMARAISAANGASVTLHRAFDLCADPFATLEQAVTLGVDTILTSGCAANAPLGAQLLAELNNRAAGRVEVLAGGGVNSGVVAELATVTGCHAYHLSGKMTLPSGMVYRKSGVPMGLPLLSEYELWRTDSGEIAKVRAVLESLPDKKLTAMQ